MATPPPELLRQRLDRMVREDGLLDFKVSLGDTSRTTVDDVCAELLGMVEDFCAGRTVPLCFGDSRRAA